MAFLAKSAEIDQIQTLGKINLSRYYQIALKPSPFLTLRFHLRPKKTTYSRGLWIDQSNSVSTQDEVIAPQHEPAGLFG